MPIITRSRASLMREEERVLPTEVIYEIIRHTDFNDWIKFRFVKRSWNEAACRLLRGHPKLEQIRIRSRKSLLDILELKNNGIQPWFLTNFHLALNEFNVSSAIQFGVEFGRLVKKLTLDARKKSSTDKKILAKLREILTRTPNVENLTIIGNNDGTSFMEELDEICQLHRVKTLELKSLFDPVLSVIDHSVIIGWVKRTPALGTLIVSSTLNPSSNSQLSSFFAHVKHIQHLSLCLRFKPENQDMFLTLADAKVHSLNMVVEMDEADDHNLLFLNMYSWLATQSPYLRRFVHQLHTQITDGPILDKLKLFRQPLLTSGRSVQPFRVGQSSSLYFVTVLSINSEDVIKSYQPLLSTTGLFEHMEASIMSINKKTTNILRYLFPKLHSIHSSHYFVA